MNNSNDDRESVKIAEWHLAHPPTKNTFLHYDYILTRHLFHNYSALVTQLLTPNNATRKRLLTKLWKLLEISNNGFVWVALFPVFLTMSTYLNNSNNRDKDVITRVLSSILTTRAVHFYYFACLVDLVCVGSIKQCVRRVRPSRDAWFLSENSTLIKSRFDIGPDQYSLPSGHATRGMLITVIFWYWGLCIAPHHTNASWLVLLVVTSWNLLVGFSRVCLGRHYISDVLLGWCLGLIESYVAFSLWWTFPVISQIPHLLSNCFSK